jgi:hypothetical protein
MTALDLVAYSMFDIHGNPRDARPSPEYPIETWVNGWGGRVDTPWDGSNPLNWLWFVVVKGFNETEQTILNTQTHLVKSQTRPLRDLYSHDNDTLHRARRFIAMDVLAKYDPVMVGDGTVDVEIMYEGKRLPLSIAGHMINPLLNIHVFNTDIGSQLRAIERNLEWHETGTVSKGQRDVVKWKMQGESDTDYTSLWHNYWEYYVGIYVYAFMAKSLGWEPDMAAISLSIRTLDRLARRYPFFKTERSKNTRR